MRIPWPAGGSPCSGCSPPSRTTRRAAVARERYLEANPAASYYIDFGDFTFLRLTVDHVRYVGGYGRMSWVDAADYRTATPDPLVDAAAGIIEHMNADHADAQVLFCRHFAGLTDTESATMSAVDRYGFDLVAVSADHRTAVRLAFPDECTTGDEVRAAMVAMVTEARAAIGLNLPRRPRRARPARPALNRRRGWSRIRPAGTPPRRSVRSARPTSSRHSPGPYLPAPAPGSPPRSRWR